MTVKNPRTGKYHVDHQTVAHRLRAIASVVEQCGIPTIGMVVDLVRIADAIYAGHRCKDKIISLLDKEPSYYIGAYWKHAEWREAHRMNEEFDKAVGEFKSGLANGVSSYVGDAGYDLGWMKSVFDRIAPGVDIAELARARRMALADMANVA